MAKLSDIKGLQYIPDALTPHWQELLLKEIDSKPWDNTLKRRTQHYGWRYDYRERSIRRDMKAPPMPFEVSKLALHLYLSGRTKVPPDQCIVNEYEPGQGIAHHVDCVPCFEDTIISVSLGSIYTMEFRRGDTLIEKPLGLGSILVLSGESRYKWTHGIEARKKDRFSIRRRRVSLTFRRVIIEN